MFSLQNVLSSFATKSRTVNKNLQAFDGRRISAHCVNSAAACASGGASHREVEE